jgi:hypothetical protein
LRKSRQLLPAGKLFLVDARRGTKSNLGRSRAGLGRLAPEPKTMEASMWISLFSIATAAAIGLSVMAVMLQASGESLNG